MRQSCVNNNEAGSPALKNRVLATKKKVRGKDQQGRQAEPKGTPGEGKRVEPKLENQRFASTGAGFSQNCICRSKKALGAFGDALGGPRDALRGRWGRLGGSLGTPWGVKGTPWGAKRRVHPGKAKRDIRNAQKGLRRRRAAEASNANSFLDIYIYI